MNKAARFIRRLFVKRENTGNSGYSPRRVGTPLFISDIPVNTAMSVATFYRCVDIVSGMIASLPMRYLSKKGDVFTEDTASGINYLLQVQPDDNISAYEFKRQIVSQIMLTGNAYIIPIYDYVQMDYVRLVLCTPGTVSHDTINNVYTVNDTFNGINGKYDESEMIHLMGQTLDGKNGLSVLSFARLTLNIASSGDRETLSRFKNGGNVRGIISNDNSAVGFGQYQDTELEKQAKAMDEQLNGINGDGMEHIVAMNGDVKFTQLSMSSADMQFLESRKYTVREICRFCGVHPVFVYDDSSSNYKTVEMANIAFHSQTLNPILTGIENEFNRKLITRKLYRKRKFEFDRRGIYTMDLDSKVRYQTQTIAAGLYTVNEWRKEDNKMPVEGGDRVLVSANLKSIDDPTFENQENNTDEEQGQEQE